VTRLVILLATYLLIAVRQVPFLRLNRPAAALLGALVFLRAGVKLPLLSNNHISDPTRLDVIADALLSG
jgi:hypothetical protein